MRKKMCIRDRGRIFCVMLSDLAEKEVTTVEGINTGLGGNREVLKKK